MSYIDKSQMNMAFLEVLNDPTMSDSEKSAGLSKVASGIIRTFVEQEGFSGKIVPPQPLTREQCIPTGIEGDLYVLRPIDDHKVYSVQTSRMGKPTGRYVRGKDYKINVAYRTSEEISKNTRELQDTYTYDIQDLFESRIGLSMQKLQDSIWMQLVWEGLGYNTKTGALKSGANSGSKQIYDLRSYWGTDGTSKGLTSEMFVLAIQKFASKSNVTGAASNDIAVINSNFVPNPEKPLIPITVLMNEFDFADLGEMPASEIGDLVKAEFFQAYNLPHIKGVQIVRTIHMDIIPRGHLYFFTSPEFIGHNFEIDPIQVVTKVDSYNFEMKMKGTHFAGQGIGNIYSFWEVLFTPRGEDNGAYAALTPTCPVLSV